MDGERRALEVDETTAHQDHERDDRGGHEDDRSVTSPPADTDFLRLRADALTSDQVLRPRAAPPGRGWRLALYRATGGRISIAPSAAERRERELVAWVKTPVSGCRRVAVISRKGGVGKTTSTLMLGHVFAGRRGDRGVAVDANPDAGSLADRLERETPKSVTDVLADIDDITRYADIRAYTSQAPSRLEVVAGDADPRISRALREPEYRRAVSLLERHYNLILLDTGTGILDSATQGVLADADQIVLVAAANLDGARVASRTLDWLDEHGRDDLVSNAVVVINCVRRRHQIDMETVGRHFADRCESVLEIPWDPHLATGAEVRPEELRPATARAYLQLAAAVARLFPSSSGSTYIRL